MFDSVEIVADNDERSAQRRKFARIARLGTFKFAYARGRRALRVVCDASNLCGGMAWG